jgi:hypothetical protein
VHESAPGTKLPIAALHITAGIEGKTDMSRTSRDGIVLAMDMTPAREGHMASYIARRKFLATLGGAAAWSLAARRRLGCACGAPLLILNNCSVETLPSWEEPE